MCIELLNTSQPFWGPLYISKSYPLFIPIFVYDSMNVSYTPVNFNKLVKLTFNEHFPDMLSSSLLCSPLGKLGGSKGTWGEGPPPTVVTSELWGAPTGKSRGPPPGLSNKNTPGNAGGSSGGAGGGNSSNGWGSLASGGGAGNAAAVASTGGGRATSWGIQGTAAGSWGSTWLLLKNLTPQVS